MFTIIEVVLLPITEIDYVWLATKLLLLSRRTGVSTTAYSLLIASARSFWDENADRMPFGGLVVAVKGKNIICAGN